MTTIDKDYFRRPLIKGFLELVISREKEYWFPEGHFFNRDGDRVASLSRKQFSDFYYALVKLVKAHPAPDGTICEFDSDMTHFYLTWFMGFIHLEDKDHNTIAVIDGQNAIEIMYFVDGKAAR